jgi:hypothetical protein
MDVTNYRDCLNVRPRIVCLCFLLALAPSACTSIHPLPSAAPRLEAAAPAVRIDPDALLGHIEVLASDAFEGRKPGTTGEALTVDYLVKTLKRFGLQPGNPDGSYLQEVPLVGITSEPRARLMVRGEPVAWLHRRDFAGGSGLPRPISRVENSELVFVGYGVVAPEYGWDDYKGADMRGKTVVALMNDPQVADPANPARLDPAMFKGVGMTSYATSRHKRETAVARGAVARITVHEQEQAGAPFSIYANQSGRERLQLRDHTEPQLEVELTIPIGTARELFRRVGLDFDVLRAQAQRKDFKPVSVAATATFDVANSIREVRSNNVVARAVGSDPKLKDEVVVYAAHWDHLGRGQSLQGNQIYYGAVDNATGVAALLEIARSYAALSTRTARSVLFIATTAEEAGMLGAKYYAGHPLYPLASTLVDLNLDVLGPWGRTEDFQIIGWGESDLDGLVAEVAALRGKRIVPDQRPEAGNYYRQDAVEFATAGVPSLWLGLGVDSIDKPPGYRKQKRDYFANDYHQVTDIVRPDWDLSGGAELAEFAFDIGYRLARGGPFPQWLPGTEFKAKRDAMMKAQR